MNTTADTTYTFPLKLGNLVWLRLWLKKEYPLEGLLWRVGCGALYFLFQQFSGTFSILQNSHLLNCNLIQLL